MEVGLIIVTVLVVIGTIQAAIPTWTVVAAVGAAISAVNTWDSRKERRRLGDGNGGLRIIANGWVRRDLIRLAVQITWAGIGLWSLAQGSTSSTHPVVLLLVWTNYALAFSAFLDMRERLQIVALREV